MHRAVLVVTLALAPSLSLGASQQAAQQLARGAPACVIDSAKAMRIDTLTFYLLPGRQSKLDQVTEDRVTEIVVALPTGAGYASRLAPLDWGDDGRGA